MILTDFNLCYLFYVNNPYADTATHSLAALWYCHFVSDRSITVDSYILGADSADNLSVLFGSRDRGILVRWLEIRPNLHCFKHVI